MIEIVEENQGWVIRRKVSLPFSSSQRGAKHTYLYLSDNLVTWCANSDYAVMFDSENEAQALLLLLQ